MSYSVDFGIVPASGPVGGGIPTRITGAERPNVVTGVNFGGSVVPATLDADGVTLHCVTPPGAVGRVGVSLVRMASVPWGPAINWREDPNGYHDLPSHLSSTDFTISGITGQPPEEPQRLVQVYQRGGGPGGWDKIGAPVMPNGSGQWALVIPANTMGGAGPGDGNGTRWEFAACLVGDGPEGPYPSDGPVSESTVYLGNVLAGPAYWRFYGGALTTGGLKGGWTDIRNSLNGVEDRLRTDFILAEWGAPDPDHSTYFDYTQSWGGAVLGFVGTTFNKSLDYVTLKMSHANFDAGPPAGWYYLSPAGDYTFTFITQYTIPTIPIRPGPEYRYIKRPPKLYVHT